MSLHMIQSSPDMGRLMRWAERERLVSIDGDLGYALHVALTAAFGDLAPKPFMLLADPRRGAPKLLGYSSAAAADLVDHASTFADPLFGPILGLADLASKEMPETFPAGKRLGFRVRIRPTVRTSDRGPHGEKELDAFVLDKRPKGSVDRGTVYAEWVRARLQGSGAEPESMRLDAFRRTRVLRREASANETGKRPVRQHEGPDVTVYGTLTVSDPTAFPLLLAKGIGRHRAFGFGMILLTPPGQA